MTPNILARLSKLEDIASPPRSAREFVVIGGGTELDLTAFLRSQGEAVDEHRDIIVHAPGFSPSEPRLVGAYDYDAAKYGR